MNPHTVQFSEKKTTKKRGCTFGCLGAAIGIPLLLIFIGYLLLMHSALPLRLMANIINKDDQISIEGVGGSISKGITIKSLRASDDQGNESVFEGLVVQWGDINRMRTKREVVIEEIGLERAHIFMDFSESEPESEAESSEENTEGSSSSGDPLNLFEIKKIDIRKVILQAKDGDFKLELDRFLMEGLRIKDDNFDLASLSVASNMLDLRLEDTDSVMFDGKKIPFKRRIVGTVKSDFHETLARDIGFTVELGAISGAMVTRLEAFDGAVKILDLGKTGKASATVEAFTPSDYFGPEYGGPIKDLSMKVVSIEKEPETDQTSQQLEEGQFTLGTTKFVMAAQTIGEQKKGGSMSALPILATARQGDLKITAALTEKKAPPFFRINLASEPTRRQPELLSLLLFETPFAELSAEQVAEVKKIETQHFTKQE